MSSYKPKMFRSQDGCCICRAKSSSSRFTQSEKYSESFEGCFKISDFDIRTGDICNACVLIVKRWKKLPLNSTKDWAHVVDARAGPGGKTVVRPKRGEEENLKYKHVYKRKGVPLKVIPHSSRKRNNSEGSSRSETPSADTRSETDDNASTDASLYPSFLDSHYWKRTIVCCGVIFIGQLKEITVDQRFYKPCGRGKHNFVKITIEESDNTTASVTNTDNMESDFGDENKEFYGEERKQDSTKCSNFPAIIGQLDSSLETFSKCD